MMQLKKKSHYVLRVRQTLHQISIFIHGHRKRPHAPKKPLIIVFNQPFVLLPDGLPLNVVLHKDSQHIKEK